MTRRVAIPVNEANILDGHFGHCKAFALYDVDEKKVVAENRVDAPPHQPGLLPGWLAERGVTDVVAGGMGQRAIDLFNQRSVNVFVGAPAIAAPELLEGFLDQTLTFKANYCDH